VKKASNKIEKNEGNEGDKTKMPFNSWATEKE
jgi:hypothetical protein